MKFLEELFLIAYHRHTREIPEPAPFLSRHGAQIGGIRVFPTIKITVIHQVRSERENTCETLHGAEDHRRILFACVSMCV